MDAHARAHTHTHAPTDTKIETKFMSPHFELSPTVANNKRNRKKKKKHNQACGSGAV